MRYFQIIIFLSLAYSMVGQQHCAITLQGFITNREDQKALSYASVFILETGQYALSNDNGSWQIDNVCPGKYHIKIDHLGCESQSIFASIQNDTSIVVILEHHVELLSVVDVTDSRLPQSSTKANYEVSGKYLARLKSQNLGEVAKMIPGVDAIKTGTTIAKPTIHGLSGNRVAIVSDGVMVEGQQWGMDHAPEIDISNTGSVKVIKGSAPILYGSMATAGVIISEISRTSDPHLHGKIRYNYQSNGQGHHLAVQLFKNNQQWKQYLGGASKKSGDLQTPSYYLRNTGLSEQSLDYIAHKLTDHSSLKYTFKLYRFNAGILRSAHIGNLTDLKSAITRDVPFFTEENFTYNIAAPRQLVNHGSANISFQRDIDTKSNLTLRHTLQLNNRKEFDVRRADRTGTPIVNMLLTNNLSEALYEFKPNNTLKYLYGTSLRLNINYNLVSIL